MRTCVANGLIPREYLLCVFFNDTATTEIYTLSLHDALPILARIPDIRTELEWYMIEGDRVDHVRSEEHTSELQSHHDIVCRLLLEKKKHRAFSLSTATALVLMSIFSAPPDSP